MSIDSTQPAAPLSQLSIGQELRARIPNLDSGKIADEAHANKSMVTLSALIQSIKTNESGDVDYARVENIRAAIAAGELPIEPEKIAHVLVQHIFEY